MIREIGVCGFKRRSAFTDRSRDKINNEKTDAGRRGDKTKLAKRFDDKCLQIDQPGGYGSHNKGLDTEKRPHYSISEHGQDGK